MQEPFIIYIVQLIGINIIVFANVNPPRIFRDF